MYKIILYLLLIVSVPIQAQEPITYLYADSISYQHYMAGNWDKLIETGEQALKQDVDFKRLRQRMGYAYFAKADYYAAQHHYQKALVFDKNDLDTRAYLYYCGLNVGNEPAARFHASKMSNETQQYLKIKPLKLVSTLDVEYNYKMNYVRTRSNPTYYRLGIKSQLGNRLSLYQSASQYNQTVNLTTATKQLEYYALFNWSMSAHTVVDVAYHYVNTQVDTTAFPGNLFYGKLSTNINRFRLGINGSVLSNETGNFVQTGLHAGLTLPGKAGIYLNSCLSNLMNNDSTRFVFSQSVGAHLLKPLWVEANVTLGNLKNYTDNDGLYLYNSLDATVFRTGATFFLALGKSITFIGNYTYDTKQIEEYTLNYHQHSFSGGILWKL